MNALAPRSFAKTVRVRIIWSRVLWLGCAALLVTIPTVADEPGVSRTQVKQVAIAAKPAQKTSPKTAPEKDLIGSDPGESIYNDKLRRFKFRLEHIDVNGAETAEMFSIVYASVKDNPKIIGVWGDTINNSIVVVGPPEAEQPIRNTLAVWQAEVGSSHDGDLDVRMTLLKRERKETIQTINELELNVVDLQNEEEADRGVEDKLKTLKKRYNASRSMLAVIDRKIYIVKTNQALLADDQTETKTVATQSKPNLNCAVISTSIAQQQVEISIGIDDGVQRKDKFVVYRVVETDGQPTRTIVGEIEVVKVTPDRSVARITQQTVEGQILRGDRATRALKDDVAQ